MVAAARQIVEQHWQAANARDWETFAALLNNDLLYQVPQTREQIHGAAGYIDLFQTWPQPWRVEVQQIIAEAQSALSVIRFIDDNDSVTGISLFEIEDGKITRVTDYWPADYTPPQRITHFIERY